VNWLLYPFRLLKWRLEDPRVIERGVTTIEFIKLVPDPWQRKKIRERLLKEWLNSKPKSPVELYRERKMRKSA